MNALRATLDHAEQHPNLTDVVCWSRMQAEAGQELDAIVSRKELERTAGNGVFLWGVGNPPAKAAAVLARAGTEVDLVFSIMKSKAKPQDVAPTSVALWQTYFDHSGQERILPPTSVVTSRAESASGVKSAHYALICRSDTPLSLGDYGPFDHTAYRNVSEVGGQIAASQVTALVRRLHPERTQSSYRINLRAKLTGSYWVRLGSPILLNANAREILDNFSQAQTQDIDSWARLSHILRKEGREVENFDRQPRLL